jgi:hypothetical protein
MEAALGEIRRGDDAAARNRWADASRAYRAADARLRDLEDRCAHDIAERAAAAIDDLLTKRAAADVEAPGAGCAQVLGEARGKSETATALASRQGDAAEVDKLFALAEEAWAEAVAVCGGDERQQALVGKADLVRARTRVASARSAAVEPPPVPETRTVAPSPPPPPRVQREIEPVAPVPVTTAPAPAPPPVPPAVRAEPTEAPAEKPKSFEQAVSSAAAKAAAFLDRTVAGAATALGLPVDGEVLRVGTTTYTGNFRRDAAGGTVSGQGKVEWNNGDVFNGTLVQGKAEGRGSMAWRKTGSRYEGDWRNDLQNGRGTMVFGDGTRYVGDFVDGHLTGRGRYEYAGVGESYEGEVLDGKPHGQGTYTWKSGDRYDGAWRAGRKSGQGRYTWTDGSYWEGEYENDERTENGRTVFPIPSR